MSVCLFGEAQPGSWLADGARVATTREAAAGEIPIEQGDRAMLAQMGRRPVARTGDEMPLISRKTSERPQTADYYRSQRR
jgi:hypothetical protein